MRVFIAIELPSEVKEEISRLTEILANTGARVGWVKKDSIHLTLKFLGEAEEKVLRDVKERLEKLSLRMESFKIKVEGTGWFPENVSNPRVLWIGVKYPEQLKTLWKEVEREMWEIGLKKEERDFSPHITIGRVKGREGIGNVLEILKKFKNHSFGEARVKDIVLFQSILKPDGAEYMPLKRFPLKA